MVMSGCAAYRAFYYTLPDTPEAAAAFRECQRTSEIARTDQWAVMGRCLNTIPGARWEYGIDPDISSCSEGSAKAKQKGWVLYDCYIIQ